MHEEIQLDKALAHGTLRLSLGISSLMHGLVRLPILATFAAEMAKNFTGTVLPRWFVYSFGLVLPFVEALIGIALVLGLLTRWALLAGSLLMSILIFGTCICSDWATVGIQITYAIAYFLALLFLKYDQYSLDRALRTRKRG